MFIIPQFYKALMSVVVTGNCVSLGTLFISLKVLVLVSSLLCFISVHFFCSVMDQNVSFIFILSVLYLHMAFVPYVPYRHALTRADGYTHDIHFSFRI
jgi:hypothetical protein